MERLFFTGQARGSGQRKSLHTQRKWNVNARTKQRPEETPGAVVIQFRIPNSAFRTHNCASSSSSSRRNKEASPSEGIKNPVRGETVKASTAGPSIRQLRLNC